VEQASRLLGGRAVPSSPALLPPTLHARRALHNGRALSRCGRYFVNFVSPGNNVIYLQDAPSKSQYINHTIGTGSCKNAKRM